MPGMPGAPGGYPGAPGAPIGPVGPGNYPSYYDQRYRSSANAKFAQAHWLWLLMPLVVLSRVL